MNNKKIKLLKVPLGIYSLLLMLSTSCSVNGTLQGLVSYRNKTTKQAPDLLVKPEDSNVICATKTDDKPLVYVINGKQLRTCIEDNGGKFVVYLWKPKCRSPICYPIDLVQSHYEAENINVVVVADYYDSELMQLPNNLKTNILGIDTKYYHSNFTAVYQKRFLYDLTQSEEEYSQFYLFENGTLIERFDIIGGGGIW